MAWVAVSKNGKEFIYSEKPDRCVSLGDWWHILRLDLPKGMIKKMIGRTLTWDDEPVELKEE
jgi:hypothetical protein